MKKSAILFIDYNETFDDINDTKGKIFTNALKRFCRHFDGNVKVVVITAAAKLDFEDSILPDIVYTLNCLPDEVRKRFAYLIEENCRFITPIINFDDHISFGVSRQLSKTRGNKKDGIETFLNNFDPHEEIETCVFAGDSENLDLVMFDADVGSRNKIMIMANKRVLKSPHKIYKLSMQKQPQEFHLGKDIFEKVENDNFIIKTTNRSYGVGKGLEATTCYLEEKERG